MKAIYPVANTVSIWAGIFADENKMDECTDHFIEPSLRLGVPLSAICEVAFETAPIPLRQLLEGFSGWESFVDRACEAASRLGLGEANAALVCYALLCDAEPKQWQGVTFLGSFAGQDVT